MSEQDLEKIYKDIRKRVHKTYEKRKEYAIHATAFIVSMVVLWLFIFNPGNFGGRGFFEFIATLISGVWAIGFAVHSVDFLMTELRERAIKREIERTRLFNGVPKLKNNDMNAYVGMRLSEDGELLEFDYDESDESSRSAST